MTFSRNGPGRLLVPRPLRARINSPAGDRRALRLPLRTLVVVLSAVLLAACGTADPEPAPVPTPRPRPGAVVSISLDDGSLGHLKYAQPALAAAQLPATFYLISDALGYGGTSLDVDQAKQLVAAGQEIGNHTKTHQDLTKLSPPQMASELEEAQTALTQRLGVTPTTCAYPYGADDPAVVAQAARMFKGCRSTTGGENRPGFDAYDLATFVVTASTTQADVRAALEQAKTDQAWLIFTFHGIDPESTSEMDITPAAFSSDLRAIRDSGIAVEPVGRALVDLGR
jgi:peptidoglycan/xylan/chitin deacetylase (PgdA/CDA1 family)